MSSVARTVMMLMLASLAGAASAPAQEPPHINARIVNQQVTSLDRDVQVLVAAQTDPAWIGYAVPIVDSRRHICCGSGDDAVCCRGCQLEAGRGSGVSFSRRAGASAALEGPALAYVFLRVAEGGITKIRAFSEDCAIDAGGRTVFWLTGVEPAASVRLLRELVPARSAEGDDRSGSAITAIAMHGDPAADAALAALAEPAQPVAVRKQAAFWLGTARGRQGLQVLRRMLREDEDAQVRKAVVFALSQSPEPDALDTLIGAARGDSRKQVRREALFWLSQKAGARAAETITDAILNDPETEVKKQAVFALSQLPGDEGVPRLIDVARTNRNPHVRTIAMFWLGQSKDPRALAFFEEVLR